MDSFTRVGPSARSPSFFKVMVGDFSKDLRIPPAFVKHFDGVVPHKSSITRSTPDGKAWFVYVQKIGQRFFFRKGWREFVEDNLIESGDFLVFHYVGNSKFEVVIYGKHCCEKELSAATANNDHTIRENGQILPKVSCKRRGKSNSLNTNSDGSSDGNVESDTDEDGRRQGNETKYKPNGTPLLPYKVKARGFKAASKFVSDYPYFKVVMRPTYIIGSLRIPKEFSSTHIKGSSRKAKIWASDRCWAVKLRVHRDWSGLGRGWHSFVKDNALAVGDVCVFEMLQRFHRICFDARASMIETIDETKMAKRRENVSLSQESPEFFKVYIHDFSHEHLHIPPAFVEVFRGSIPKNAILRDIRGKCCHVELEEVEMDVFIKNGWQEFLRDHSVAEGDFLVFRYDGKVLFDISIFGISGCRKDESPDIEKTIVRVKREEVAEEELTKPHHDYEPMQLELRNGMIEKSGSLEVSRRKSLRVLAIKSAEYLRNEAASFVQPKNPHFVALIRHSSQFNLHIPRRVLKKKNIKLGKEMVVRDQKQRLWPMRVITRMDGRHNLVKGWTNFWKANNVGVGDQCLFEFIIGRGRISKEIHVQVVHASKMAKNPNRS